MEVLVEPDDEKGVEVEETLRDGAEPEDVVEVVEVVDGLEVMDELDCWLVMVEEEEEEVREVEDFLAVRSTTMSNCSFAASNALLISIKLKMSVSLMV